jgi:hypothetical protein
MHATGGVGRAFMTCVTEIDPNWIPLHAKAPPSSDAHKKAILPSAKQNHAKSSGGGGGAQPHLLLKLSKPLESHQPTYDSETDCVKCFVTPSFGVHGWQLKPLAIPMKETRSSEEEEIRHFAK